MIINSKKLKNELSYNSLTVSNIGEGWGFSKIYRPFILLWVVNKLSGYSGLTGRVCLAPTPAGFCIILSRNAFGQPQRVVPASPVDSLSSAGMLAYHPPSGMPIRAGQVYCAITCGRQGSVLVYGYKINKIVELCKNYACKVIFISYSHFAVLIGGERCVKGLFLPCFTMDYPLIAVLF
ncbi:hypothetical protein EZS27_007800 [termite gut metagenome]|uniref:Uncharacterized protein n=1 Tax=termite gut metagenome TaxID=433724 RepID=A0A5J4SFP6_9ZZZZ